MKKALKITGIVILILLIALIAAPFLFESQLKDYVKRAINKNLNATVEFSDLDLTLFKSFPQATLVISDVSVINHAPFAGDTLALGEEVLLQMSIKELFKSGDTKKVDEIRMNNAFINIKVDSLGNANYDILKETPPGEESEEEEEEEEGFKLDLKHYEINNSRLRYSDLSQDLSFYLEDLNHNGTGDFGADESELETHTTSIVSFDMGGTNYLNKNKVTLDAVIHMDLEEMIFTFRENEALINQLPLTFNGYVDVNEDHNFIDLSFATPTSDFKNFLAVIPETYSKNIENVQTTGDFIVNGIMKGRIDEELIPTLDIKVSSNNASFKYPELPKSVEDINLDIKILNTTGIAEDTYLTFDNVRFRIDQDQFATNGSLRNLTGNMLVDMALKGTINLANLNRAYPLDLDQDLNGILTADLTTSFDMNSIEKEQYQNVKSTGKASLKDFKYTSPEIPNRVDISTADLNFSQGNVRVQQFAMNTGQTDLNATGTIQNLMGYLFTDQQLKGEFNVKSNTFSVSDFSMPETEGTSQQTTAGEAIKIPSFLDVKLDFIADRVLYDNLVLTNTKGTLFIKDETATLQNITANIFDGAIALGGNVSTKEAVPTFEMDLKLSAIDIAKSFDGLELFQSLTPIARALEGTLQTDLKLAGNLNDDLTPMLASLAGDAFAKLITADVNPERLGLLSKMNEMLPFIDLNNLNLTNLQSRFSFSNGAVHLEPVNFNVKGIPVQIAGSHGFDMQMKYNLNLDVPAKMLGSQISSTLANLSNQDLQNMSIALPVSVSGTFQQPQINLNMEKAVTDLTHKIVEQQKKDLTQKGVNALKDLIPGREPTTQPGQTTDTIPSPATTPQEQVKDAAKNLLEGLLGGKKKGGN